MALLEAVVLLEMVRPCWRSCGFVGESVDLLEKVCQWKCALGFQKLKTGPPPLANPYVEHMVSSPAPCMPVFHRASRHVNNGLNINPVSQP